MTIYIQVTTRCNMSCKHCCFACTRKGKDMAWSTFEAAIRCAQDCGDHVVLGGGEPTLHPLFFDMLALAVACTSDEIVPLVVTNGSISWKAIALANMAKGGSIHAALSCDAWHDPISQDVVKAFTRRENRSYGSGEDRDCREIRTVENLCNSGRCDFGDDTCACDEVLIAPSGVAYQCGCDGAPRIGDVVNGYQTCGWDEYEDDKVCYKKITKWRSKRGRKKVRQACG